MGTNRRPLEGKRVVVTRAAEQAAGLAHALEELGAQAICLSAIEFAEPEDFSSLDRAIEALELFGWVILTSANAARFFARRAQALGRKLSPDAAARPQIAAIGQATAEAARAAGLAVDFVARRSTGEDLARELGERVRGGRVLVPASDRAREELPRALAAAGAQVVQAVAYRTVAAPVDAAAVELLRRGEADVVTFASPSAFASLARQLGLAALGKLTLAAIGPTTARAIRAAGLEPAIEAREANTTGLAEAVAEHFTRPDTKRRDGKGAKRK